MRVHMYFSRIFTSIHYLITPTCSLTVTSLYICTSFIISFDQFKDLDRFVCQWNEILVQLHLYTNRSLANIISCRLAMFYRCCCQWLFQCYIIFQEQFNFIFRKEIHLMLHITGYLGHSFSRDPPLHSFYSTENLKQRQPIREDIYYFLITYYYFQITQALENVQKLFNSFILVLRKYGTLQ